MYEFILGTFYIWLAAILANWLYFLILRIINGPKKNPGNMQVKWKMNYEH